MFLDRSFAKNTKNDPKHYMKRENRSIFFYLTLAPLGGPKAPPVVFRKQLLK